MHLYQDPEVSRIINNLAVLTASKIRNKLQVTEYLDMTTGEIIFPITVQKMGVRTIRPEAGIRRRKKLDALRKEPREFANFILRFRDNRCGFLVPLPEIVKWYSKTTDKTPFHVRRYFGPLIQGGILDSSTMLNEDFMVNNPHSGKSDAKGGRAKALNVYDGIRLSRK